MTTIGENIALLVPYRDDYAVGRAVNWDWLRRYWAAKLPGAQIVVGTDTGYPFSKTCAVNDGFHRIDPVNDIIAMVDADCYIDAQVILDCADAIREARRWHEPLWFVPYRHLYRLTGDATTRLIASDPAAPFEFTRPHTPEDVTSTEALAAIGHRFGALIQIFPREAFIQVGGMDPRMRGWGGEDVTMVRVLDTLYGIHQTTPNEVLTLWHTALGDTFLRKWAGQPNVGANDQLSVRYRKTRRDPARMKAIIREWLDDPKYNDHIISPLPPWYSTSIATPHWEPEQEDTMSPEVSI